MPLLAGLGAWDCPLFCENRGRQRSAFALSKSDEVSPLYGYCYRHVMTADGTAGTVGISWADPTATICSFSAGIPRSTKACLVLQHVLPTG
jgi:hypothetical protein